MPRLLALLIACLLPIPLFAQPTTGPFVTDQANIKGRVLDPLRAPLAGARVTAQPDGASRQYDATTDDKGGFTLAVPPGAYTITIGADGFAGASRRVQVTETGASVPDVLLLLDVVLESVTVEAKAGYDNRIIVSSTKVPVPLRDVPHSISIVGAQLISDLRLTSMSDVVQYVPGVSMAQGEGNRDTPILRGNGSTSDFFVDGVRDDVQYMRDVYNLERVEVVKGPNAMLFGRGGAGGFINRVTRQAEWGQSREIVLQGGSFENRRLTTDLGTALSDAAAVRVTGLYEDTGSYRDGVGIERYGVNPSAVVRLGPATLLRASYEHFHDERAADRGVSSFDGRPLDTARSTFFGDPGRSPVRATVNALASTIEHRFSTTGTIRNRLSFADYDKFYQNVFPGAVGAAGDRVAISAYNNATDRRNLFNQTDLMLTPQFGGLRHTLLAGVELGRQVTDNFRSTGYFTSLGPAVTSVQVPVDAPTISMPVEFRQSATDADNHGVATVAAVYLQDQVELLPQVSAIAGLRFDAFDVTFTNNRTGAVFSSEDRLISPRLGLVYKPRTAVSLYGSYTLTYLPRSGDQLSSLSLTNQALDPETFRNYEMGLKWDVRPALSLAAAAYRLNRGNVAVSDPADPTRSILVDAQRTIGLEVEMTGALTRAWSVTAGYAWQDGEITRSLSSTAQAGAVLAQVPKHSLSIWNKYDVTDRVGLGVGVIYRGEVFTSTDNRVALPDFTRVDAGVFYNLTARLRLQANVENLFDASYFLNAHSNNNITPGSPRAVRAALTARF